ncbi:MAG: DUF3999 family protein [Acidobacteria bacterium]|nr:DUF3999 family protein [Acidobacteriota bacterium]
MAALAAMAAMAAMTPTTLAAAAAPPAGNERPQGTPYSRPVEVPAAGWVRVPLDLGALRHIGLPGSLQVTAPTGEELPRWIAPWNDDNERRPVKVLGVAKDDHGWTLRLDVGPEPLAHERLLLDFARLTIVPDVALDASQDGKSWEPLVAGDLFRLGSGAGLARTSLPYPTTSARYLRLSWPASAGFPELRGVLVEPTSPGRSLTLTSRSSPCRDEPSAVARTCRLPLPAAGQTVRRLIVELDAGANVGYLLYQPRQGAWEPLAQGVWRGSRSGRHVLPLPGAPLAGDNLRLELFGAAGDPAPRLLGHSFDLAVDTVLFYAETPGRYTLSYGGVPSPGPAASQPDARSVAAGVEAAWIAPGPEEQARTAPLPAAGPGAPLPRERFRAAWAVTAAGAAPGDLVRLALPDAVYAQARPDLGDLRLVAGGRQLPYVRWTPPDPVQVVERADLRPEAEKGRRYSRIEIYLPAAGLPITQLQMTAPPSPLRRPIGVRYPDPGPPGLAAREERLVAHGNWECLPEPPLPCRLALPLPGPAPRHLTMRFADGDNPPLATVDVAAWRRSDVLLFAWPSPVPGQGSGQGAERGKVQLLAGAPALTAPVYDLAALAEVLPARPAQAAQLDLTGDDLRQGAAPWWSRWVVPAAVGVAALFLLVLLRRILADT